MATIKGIASEPTLEIYTTAIAALQTTRCAECGHDGGKHTSACKTDCANCATRHKAVTAIYHAHAEVAALTKVARKNHVRASRRESTIRAQEQKAARANVLSDARYAERSARDLQRKAEAIHELAGGVIVACSNLLGVANR